MRKLTVSLVVACLLVGVLFVGVNAQQFYTTMDDVIMRSLIVSNAASVGGALAVTGNTAMAGTLATTGAATFGVTTTVGTFLVMSQGATQSIGASAAINAVATFQPISSTGGAIGTSLITLKPAGTLLRLVNVGADAIVITDTGTLKLSGNITLGTSDSLLLMSDGTNWIQMGTSDN